MKTELFIQTHQRETLVDITAEVSDIIRTSGIQGGLCNIYVPHATSGVVINENDDPNIILDFLDTLKKIAPRGIFRHDQIDGNGDAHIKSALVGPSETIPFAEGSLLLGTWQSIMICEFDGPRRQRKIIVSVLADT